MARSAVRCEIKLRVHFVDNAPILSVRIDVGINRTIKTGILKAINKDRKWSLSTRIRVFSTEGKMINLKEVVAPGMIYEVYLPVTCKQLFPVIENQSSNAASVELFFPSDDTNKEVTLKSGGLAEMANEGRENVPVNGNENVENSMYIMESGCETAIQAESDCETAIEAEFVADQNGMKIVFEASDDETAIFEERPTVVRDPAFFYTHFYAFFTFLRVFANTTSVLLSDRMQKITWEVVCKILMFVALVAVLSSFKPPSLN